MLLRPFIGLLLFLSTPSARRATPSSSASFLMSIISIHALCEEGDRILWKNFKRFMGISIHALCEEGDAYLRDSYTTIGDFYPRPLRGGRPNGNTIYDGVEVFLSTPSARRATAEVAAPRSSRKDFYPRPLRGGRRDAPAPRPWLPMNFYPRPLRGGRLDNYLLKGVTNHDFYPRPLRGGRRIHTLLSPFE